MVELPAELWLEIASHIAHQDMVQLLSVNRTFMNLALEKRYGFINLMRGDTRAIRLIDHLKHNDYATDRVNTLSLSCDILRDLISQEKSDLEYSQSQPASNYIHSLGIDTQKSSTQVAKDIDDILGKLRNVKKFTMTWVDEPSQPLDIVYPHSRAWAAFGANLENLRLLVTAPVLPLLLHQVQLPESLNELSVVVFESYRSNRPPDKDASAFSTNVLRSLSSFISLQRHLKSLDITSTWHADFSELFSSLATLPLLARLSLNLPFNGQHLLDTAGILLFMQNHAKNLTHLSLHCGSCGMPRRIHEDGASQTAVQIVERSLPYLTSLSLDVHTLWCPSDAIILFPKLGTAKLQSLHIGGLFMTLADLCSLSSGFPSDPPLRDLDVKVDKVTKEIFDLLSQSFPRLFSLHISARGPMEDGQLDRDLKEGAADYSEWLLHDLTIDTMSRSYRVDWEALRVIAPYIPSLRGFNGCASL
ncbi:hypothetical protein HGRIS_008074 [Hohenbuehelia grisea]|uniref:F-box domain-containing protein n=1 Tax=Hohenbuehelia grisea TaxID=104357 RepID=A0ABR3J6V0_9AGAR